MQQNKDKLYEILYKSYALLAKDLENIDFDSILNLIFDYLDLKLAWIGILSNGDLKLNKAKGEILNYISDESLRKYQLDILKKYASTQFLSNDVLNDKRLFYL